VQVLLARYVLGMMGHVLLLLVGSVLLRFCRLKLQALQDILVPDV
jgi:hypothetical protein